jgi:RNA methyltransferase, TrmH family
MITKGRIQFIKSLSEKKNRNAKGVFVVEGAKSVAELLTSKLVIEELYITHEFAKKYEKEVHLAGKRHAEIQQYLKPQLIEAGELKHMSTLEATDSALAIVKQPKIADQDPVEIAKKNIVLILEQVRDPGNLGTIMRIADWYGVTHIYASAETVDMYNNKTIIASMGSFTRVTLEYVDIRTLIDKLYAAKLDIVASVLDGESSHTFAWPKKGALLIGNEATGLTENTKKLATYHVSIPRFGEAESLNAAVATAILLDTWKRG